MAKGSKYHEQCESIPFSQDIIPANNDHTTRFRKKIEKNDKYKKTVLGLCGVGQYCSISPMHTLFKIMERYIKQNNAVEIYEVS